MMYLDDTQKILFRHLQKTEQIMNHLLSNEPYYGNASIVANIDLGFPHDVIRLAGGFATGIYVKWESKVPFVPIDVCMNACTVSLYELSENNSDFFSKEALQKLLLKLERSSYKANFHRGNHFISYLESVNEKKGYVMIHSSAAEFETNYNGLYPVEGNFFYNKIRTYYLDGKYIRYIEGRDAELFWKLASNLYAYNEGRHDFIITSLLDEKNKVIEGKHYHHYGMPSQQEALLGSHLIEHGQSVPLLTVPGDNVYLIKYKMRLKKSFV